MEYFFDEIVCTTNNEKGFVNEKEVLRYGEVLTDDTFCEEENDYEGVWYKWTRIRTIAYEGHIYYYKTVDGEVMEFKELI